MIFAREVNSTLTGLVKKIDEATAKNSSCHMASFVVFCSDDESLEKKLKEVADKEHLKKTILTIDNPSGPPRYKIAKDADVTVLLYVDKTIKSNYAFRKGELKDADVETILKDLSKILPGKAEKTEKK